jgi:hypothetical protein
MGGTRDKHISKYTLIKTGLRGFNELVLITNALVNEPDLVGGKN